MSWKPATQQKERFLRLCRHYVVAAPGSPTMTKACFEAHLIGMALQARQPDPGPSLGNGQWAKELLTELLPTFKWKNPKAAATKSTTNAIAVANEAATATLAQRCQRRVIPSTATFSAVTRGAKCSGT